MSFKMKRTIEMRRVESAFADYLENEGSVDLLWSDKVGYVFLTINEKTHESESCDDLHTASQLCHRLLDDMAITVLLQTKRNHNFTNMDKDEAVRVRAFWKPVIEKLPGWKCDIRGIKNYEDLPENCKKYIEFVEEHIGFPITMISNGPGRDDIIYRNK